MQTTRTINRWIKWVILLLFFLTILLVILIPSAAFYFSSTATEPAIKVATWQYQINATTDKEIVIDLVDTITNNPYSMESVIPGTRGHIQLALDFSKMKVAVDYQLLLDLEKTALPEHLTIYTDANYQIPFEKVAASLLLGDMNQPAIINLYWKWDYTEEDETTWSGQNIRLGLIFDVTQKIE